MEKTCKFQDTLCEIETCGGRKPSDLECLACSLRIISIRLSIGMEKFVEAFNSKI